MTEACPLNVVRLGTTGTPVVMLHGWGQSIGSLRPLGELLAWQHQVHLIDLPGFGGSPKPNSPWGTNDYANRILSYLDEQGLKEVNLLGHSMGGRISIRLAADHPERVLKTVLVGTPGLKASQSFKKRIRLLWIKLLRSVVKFIDKTTGTKYFANYFSPRFGSRDYLNAGEMRPTLVKVISEDLSQEASKIKSPSLLIWGENDQEAPIGIGRRYKQLIKNSKLIVFPNRDHFPFNDSGAHLCAHFILPFLGVSSV